MKITEIFNTEEGFKRFLNGEVAIHITDYNLLINFLILLYDKKGILTKSIIYSWLHYKYKLNLINNNGIYFVVNRDRETLNSYTNMRYHCNADNIEVVEYEFMYKGKIKNRRIESVNNSLQDCKDYVISVLKDGLEHLLIKRAKSRESKNAIWDIALYEMLVDNYTAIEHTINAIEQCSTINDVFTNITTLESLLETIYRDKSNGAGALNKVTIEVEILDKEILEYHSNYLTKLKLNLINKASTTETRQLIASYMERH